MIRYENDKDGTRITISDEDWWPEKGAKIVNPRTGQKMIVTRRGTTVCVVRPTWWQRLLMLFGKRYDKVNSSDFLYVGSE